MGTIGFSYIGAIFLILLFIPNILWTRALPAGYDASNESKILLVLERVGEVSVSVCAVIFTDFNIKEWTAWSWWFVAACFFMVLYELWWIGYFRSERTLKDFYSSMLGIPVGGATPPVLAFLCLGIYGKVIWMILAVIVLGIGHIGIHLEHRRAIE